MEKAIHTPKKSEGDLYLQPTTVEEALSLASRFEGKFRFIAGGTDLMPEQFQGHANPPCIIDLSGIDQLSGISLGNDWLKIGPLIKLDQLRNVREIASRFPALVEAAQSVGSPLIRKMGTIGGNLLCENRCLFFNQSEFWRESIGYCLKCEGETCIAAGGTKACFSELVSDTVPVLICLRAEIELQSPVAIRRIPLQDLFSGDGVRPRNLNPGELLTGIFLPLNEVPKVIFKKLRQRESLEFTALSSAVSLNQKGKVRIVLAGVDPGPVIVNATVSEDQETLIKEAAKKSRSVENNMLGRKYRKEMISVFLKKSFEELSSIKN